VNFTFAIIIFILGVNRIIQRIVILIVSIVMGEIVFTSGFLIGLIGTLPHGILDRMVSSHEMSPIHSKSNEHSRWVPVSPITNDR